MADFKSELLRLALGNLPKGIKKMKRTGNPAGETLVIAWHHWLDLPSIFPMNRELQKH